MGATLRQAAAVLILLASAALAGETEDAVAALERAWKGGEYQPKVDALARLVETHDRRALQLVVDRGLAADDEFVFERAFDLLKTKANDAERAWLAEQAQKHAVREVRVVLVRMCGSLETPGAADAIAAALKQSEWTLRVAGIRAARERREKSFVAPLIAVVAGDDGRARSDAIEALRDLTGADYGKDAKKWSEWWSSAEAGFSVRPAPPKAAPQADGEEGEAPAASEGKVEKKDVETIARGGLYEIRSKRTLFIVDISGSMEAKTAKGTRLEITKRELKRVIGELGPDMLFNLIFFGDKAQLWKPKMVKASGDHKSGAARLAESQKAAGQTATYDAFKLAFSLDDVDTIYFLSDGFPTVGQVTSEELIKVEVRKWNRTKGIAIYTIAFVAGELKGEVEDKARAKSFMRELAAENGGSCTIVE